MMKLLTFTRSLRLPNSGKSYTYAEVQNAHLSQNLHRSLLGRKSLPLGLRNGEGFDAFFTLGLFRSKEYLGESYNRQSQEYWDFQAKPSPPFFSPSPRFPMHMMPVEVVSS